MRGIFYRVNQGPPSSALCPPPPASRYTPSVHRTPRAWKYHHRRRAQAPPSQLLRASHPSVCTPLFEAWGDHLEDDLERQIKHWVEEANCKVSVEISACSIGFPRTWNQSDYVVRPRQIA